MPLKNVKSFTHYEVGKAIGCVAVGVIPGGRFVKMVAGGLINQPRVTLCGAGDDPDFISFYDCVDNDVALFYKGGYRNVQVGATALPGGSPVAVGAAGVAVLAAAGAPIVGKTSSDTAANGFAGVNLKGSMA